MGEVWTGFSHVKERLMRMVGFPGLGIGDFKIQSIIFSIGNFSLHWYGLIIAIGFILAVLYSVRRSPEFGYTADDIVDMLIVAVPSAVVGARLYYVAFNWDQYGTDLGAIIRIWDGGLAIYGAVIFSVIACALFCWTKHFSIGAMLDLGGMGLLIGQAVGRWGNFFNREVYGVETTLPWRMRVDSFWEVHPLFFYEFLWNSLGFVLLHFLSKKRKFNGQIFLSYVAWYGLGRGIMEGMRMDTYSLMLGNMRVSQLVGFASCFIAMLVIGYQLIMKRHEPEELLEWVKKRNEWVSESEEGDEIEEQRVVSGDAEEISENKEKDPKEIEGSEDV